MAMVRLISTVMTQDGHADPTDMLMSNLCAMYAKGGRDALETFKAACFTPKNKL